MADDARAPHRRGLGRRAVVAPRPRSRCHAAKRRRTRGRVGNRAYRGWWCAANAGGARDKRGLPSLDALARDSGHALRALRRSPAFTAAALLTLAIGIGANTAVFSVVNSVLLQPLPYPDADRIVSVSHVAPGAPGVASVSGGLRPSLSMYVTYAKENRAFDAIGVWAPTSLTVTGPAEPEQVRGVLVTDGTLQALNVPPLAGRWLTAADDKVASDTVMLGYGYWQRRFGGDRSAIGRSINVARVPESSASCRRDFGL